MAIPRAFLIAPLLLGLAGWAGTRPGRSPDESCGRCHAPHFAGRGACTTCHRGDSLALRKEVAHYQLLSGLAAGHALPGAPAVAEGRKRVERLACRRCHVIGASGNRLATNLDRIVWKRDQGDLAKSIGQPVENMPRFGLDPRRTEEVIAFLLKSADPSVSEATYRVRFSSRGSARDSAFEARCGGCHRALGANGPLGRGSAGPNLSGLFTPFYPATAPGHRAWSREALGRWLENPRAVRTLAGMRPVRLEASELERVVEDVGGAALGEPRTTGGASRTGGAGPGSDGSGFRPAEPARGTTPPTARGGSKGGW